MKEGQFGLGRSDYSGYGENVIEEGYNSGYSTFFILADDYPALDGYYTAFGKVTDGIDIIDKISKIQTKGTGEEPTEEPKISWMTVDTFGIEYPQPEKNESFNMEEYMLKFYGVQ